MDDLLDPEKKHELFISMGLDLLYRINLNQLRPKPKSEEIKSEKDYKLGPPPKSSKSIEETELADLEKLEEKYRKQTELALVFSHSTHKQPDGSYYPLGMGIFVHDSKLHFFGGQNLKETTEKHFITKSYSQPLCCGEKNWYNKKVFSFTPKYNKYDDSNQESKLHTPPSTYTTPVLNPKLHITRLKKSSPLPNHIGYKGRPFVFTILDKVYAFATKPYSNNLMYAKVTDPIDLFEVFDPNGNEWKLLPNPPNPLYEQIVGDHFPRLTYLVFNNKFILQTDFGQFVFDATKNQWEPECFSYPKTYQPYPEILAYLEYKGHLLLFFEWRDSYDLVAYDLASFGNFPFRYGEAACYTFILNIDDIDEYYRNIYCPVIGASLSLVDNNHVCLVINRMGMLHVCLLEVNTKATVKATVKAHQKISLPKDGDEENIMSTFILENDVSNQGFRQGELKSVFVSNLPGTTTTFDILQEFRLLKFGEIKPDGIFLNCKENYAFVEFEDVESHRKAIEASPIHLAGNKVPIEEVYKTNQSHLLWWRWRKQKKALKKTNKASKA